MLYVDDDCTNSECIRFGHELLCEFVAIRFTTSIFDHCDIIVVLLQSSPDPERLQLTSSQSFFCDLVHFQGNNSFVSNVKREDCIVDFCRYLGLKLRVKIRKMIPPNASLVKYDNPVLVSRNTDKKSPRVS